MTSKSGDIRSIIDHWQSSISEGWGESGAKIDQEQLKTVKQDAGREVVV